MFSLLARCKTCRLQDHQPFLAVFFSTFLLQSTRRTPLSPSPLHSPIPRPVPRTPVFLLLAPPLPHTHVRFLSTTPPTSLSGFSWHSKSFAHGVGLAVLRPIHGADPQHPRHACHGVHGGVLEPRNGGVFGRHACRPGTVVVEAGFVSAEQWRAGGRRRSCDWRGVCAVWRERRGNTGHVRVGQDRRQRMDEGLGATAVATQHPTPLNEACVIAVPGCHDTCMISYVRTYVLFFVKRGISQPARVLVSTALLRGTGGRDYPTGG